MRHLLMLLALLGVFTIGCAPKEAAPPQVPSRLLKTAVPPLPKVPTPPAVKK